MPLNKTTLKNSIQSTLQALMNADKHQIEYKAFKVSGEDIVQDTPAVQSNNSQTDVASFISFIADAVATEVIEHLNNYLTHMKATNITPIHGTGGGVPGPVICPPQAIEFNITTGQL